MKKNSNKLTEDAQRTKHLKRLKKIKNRKKNK